VRKFIEQFLKIIFSLLKYLYERDEPFPLDELPKIFKTHSPSYHEYTGDYALLHHFEFGEIKKYVTSIRGRNHWYQINQDGKRYYEFRQQESLAKEELIKFEQNNQFIGTNYGIANQSSEISESNTLKGQVEKKWYAKPLFIYIIWPLLVTLIGILVTYFIINSG
jgi:hypothetical protein